MKKKCIILFLLVTTLIALLSNYSYANSYKFTAEANKTTVNPGDEVKINLEISDINVPSNGINVVETTLVYDTSVFENFEFIEMNDWKHTYNSNQGKLYGKLLYTKMVSGVSKQEKIGALKFKLKKDLPEMETQIKLLQVTSNDGFELMNDGDKIITLKIVKETTPTNPDKPSTPDEPNTPVEPSYPVEPDTPTTPSKPENKPIVPDTIFGVQTGDFIGIVIAILLFVIIINVIIFIYTKNKKNSNINKKDIDNK